MLLTEPVVFVFSVWISFSWAVLYLQFGSIPLVFETNHGFNVEQVGAVFTGIALLSYFPRQGPQGLDADRIQTAMCVGVILATVLSIAQEKLASRWHLLPPTAEGRLYFSCIESALMPIGLFWFGWTSDPSIPYIVPALAVGCAAMGIFAIYLAVFHYLVDTYHRYASSAIAAQSCCRSSIASMPLSMQVSLTGTNCHQAAICSGGSSLW